MNFKMSAAIVITLLWTATAAHALPEKTLAGSFETLATPYFEKSVQQTMVAKDGVKIRYRVFPGEVPATATLVLVNGQSEWMSKYAELTYDLRKKGYAIFMYDHRGQGESQRLISDSKKGYVGNYQDYVDDLHQFVEEIVKPAATGKIYMLGHSMGGGISTEYLMQFPGSISAYVASSPMYGIQLPLPELLAYATVDELNNLGLGELFAFGYGPDHWDRPFEKNHVTTSPERFAYAMAELRAKPELIIAGPTNKWVLEGLRLSRKIQATPAALTTPAIIMQAGDEKLVDKDAHLLVAEESNAEMRFYPLARHELLLEQDFIRDDVITTMLQFFAKH